MGEFEDRLGEARQRAVPARPAARSTRSAPAATGEPSSFGSGPDKVPGWAKGGGGAPSLLSQAGSGITELGKSAILGLAPAVWDQTGGSLAAGLASTWLGQSADDIRDRKGVLGSVGRGLVNESAIEEFARGGGPTLRPKLADVRAKAGSQPFIGPVAESMVTEGRDLGELGVSLAPGGLKPGDTEWGKASDEGRTFMKAVEAIGAGTLFGRGALGATAAGARTAGRPLPKVEAAASAARVADDAIGQAILAPFRIPTTAARYATGKGSLLKPVERVRSGSNLRENFGRTGIPQALANTTPGQYAKGRLATPGTKPMRDELTTGDRATGVRTHAESVSPVLRTERILANKDGPGKKRPKDLVDTMDVVANIDALTRAVDGADARLGLAEMARIDEANPSAFDAYVNEVIEPQWPGTTPAAYRMFIDYRLGRLDADMATDIGRAADETRDARRQRATVEIDGEQVPIGQEAFTSARGRMEPDLTDIKAFNEQSLKREVLPGADDIEALSAAPAQFRPVVAMTRRMAEAADTFDWESHGLPQRWAAELKDSLATSVAEVLQTFDPVYAPGGPAEAFGAASTGSGRLAKKASSAFQKETGQVPMTSSRQAALLASDIRQQELNQTMMRVRDRFGRSADDFDIPEGADGRTIIAVASEQAGEPMVAWDPTKLFSRDGAGKILVDNKGNRVRSGDSALPVDDVSSTAALVPKWVADAADYAVSRDSEMAQILIDKPTRIFKGSVLALAPRWHLGNVVSGAIMMHADRVTAADLAQYGGDALKELKAFSRGEQSSLPRWLLDSNLTAQEMKALRNVAEAVENLDPDMMIKRPKSAILRAGGDVVRKGYEVNTFVDNWYKSVAYMKHVDDGVSPSQAVQRALNTLGDYDRMTPFERRVVKRVLPFWAWSRHITQMSARLAVDDPARMSLNMWIASLHTPEDIGFEPPEFLRGAARVGEEWFNLGFMFPFETTASTDFTDPAAMLTENLNPLFGTATSAVFGIEPSFDRMKPLSQPDTPFGQTGSSPLFNNPLSVPYIVGQNLPQFRAVYDEFQRHRSGGEGQRLFGTGERTGKVDPNRQLEDNLARLFGVPIPKTYDTSRR